MRYGVEVDDHVEGYLSVPELEVAGSLDLRVDGLAVDKHVRGSCVTRTRSSGKFEFQRGMATYLGNRIERRWGGSGT